MFVAPFGEKRDSSRALHPASAARYFVAGIPAPRLARVRWRITRTVVRMPGSVFSPYTSITTNILFFDRTKPTKETWFYRLDMPEGYKHFSKTKPMKLEHFNPVVEWWKKRTEMTVDGFDKDSPRENLVKRPFEC